MSAPRSPARIAAVPRTDESSPRVRLLGGGGFPGLAVIALALVIGIAMVGCKEKAKPRTPRIAVTVATAERRDMPFALNSTGTVEPLETAGVGSQVGGVVTRVAFREGDEVAKGQLLFQLDPRPFQATLEQELATLARSRAQYQTARLEASRAEKLFQQDVVSEAEWDQKRAAALTSAATLRGDSAAAQTARLNLQYASVRAPIAGKTGRLMVHEGDFVRPATVEPLVTINRTRPVRVRFTVPVSAVAMVQRYRKSGTQVIVRQSGPGSMPIEGTLVFVDNAVDPASGTLLLKGEIPNRDGRLTPGEFVDVRLVLFTESGATVVPAPAVTTGQEGAFVYVLNADSTVATRPVKVARTDDELAVVTDGLHPGETVITDGQMRLSPGAKVLVRQAPKGS